MPWDLDKESLCDELGMRAVLIPVMLTLCFLHFLSFKTHIRMQIVFMKKDVSYTYSKSFTKKNLCDYFAHYNFFHIEYFHTEYKYCKVKEAISFYLTNQSPHAAHKHNTTTWRLPGPN